MEIEFGKQTIKFNKELNALDMLAVDFCKVLNLISISYAIISGYVAILFGRNRASEDIDIFIEKIDKEKFSKLWHSLKENGFAHKVVRNFNMDGKENGVPIFILS